MKNDKGEIARNDLLSVSGSSSESRRRRSAPKTMGAPGRKPAVASGKVVGAVAAAVKILRYLSDASEPVGVTRIARDAYLNTSTCFNILRTLAAEDLVFFDPLSKTYTISLGLMDIARGATALGNDINTVRPLMERVARKHGATLTLWQPVGNNRKVLILSALAPNAIRIQMAIGQRLPMLIGATGRCFAAFSGLSDKELRRRFNEIRWDRPISFTEFRTQVRETAENGWAVDQGYFASGTVSVAVPILDNAGTAAMAVTATMFAGQYLETRTAAIVRDLRELSLRLKPIIAND